MMMVDDGHRLAPSMFGLPRQIDVKSSAKAQPPPRSSIPYFSVDFWHPRTLVHYDLLLVINLDCLYHCRRYCINLPVN